MVTHEGSDLNDLTEHAVLHHLQGLLIGNTTTDELDHISSLDYAVWVPCLLCRSHDHWPLQQVQLELNSELHQTFLYYALTLLDVLLSVLGKQDWEAAFLQEWLHLFRLELLYFPVVDVVCVPWLLLAVSLRFGNLYRFGLVSCWHVII